MQGMVHTWALAINVVMRTQPKRLRGLRHQGTGAGTGARSSPVMDRQRSRRTASPSPRRGNRAERGQPGSLLAREASRQADHRRCGSRGGKKRRPPWHGADTGGVRPTGHITRRASGQTARRWLGTRTTEESVQQVWPMAVDVCHWCSLPREGIDCCVVACSQQVTSLLTGRPYTAFERLEPDAGKLSRPVLRRGGESNLASLSRRLCRRSTLASL